MVSTRGKMVSDFDPHFKVFHELMSFKIQDILLVSSLYDAFILEEDGTLAMRLIQEYHGLNLSKAPKITRASSPEEALELIANRQFDLVITMPYLQGTNGFVLGCEIKRLRPDLPVALVAHSLRATLPPDEECACGIDNVFLWCCQADLLLAIIKSVEDSVNVKRDTLAAQVRVIIYVEDSPAYSSLLLPLMYQELVSQTQAVLDESLNERHRLLRMRARPRILMAQNYEQAIELFEAYKPYVFGVISDARFPRSGEIDAGAGAAFLRHVRDKSPDTAQLMVSSESSNAAVAAEQGAFFLDKNSPTLVEELHNFFLQQLGFGDFVFQNAAGKTFCRAENMQEFERCLANVPAESICYHLAKNHFSNWVMARAEVVLAQNLHRDNFGSLSDSAAIREELVFRVRNLRSLRQRGVVVKFSRHHYEPDVMDFVKMGTGSMGGKARGLAFMWACLQSGKSSLLSAKRVTIPKTCVVAADVFEEFLERNSLHFSQNLSDEQVRDFFLDADLPRWLRRDLRAFLQQWHEPLSVRSSSLLEDAQFRPYAGLYSTYFLANNDSDFEERLRQLEVAIKLVYASTWFESPQAFSKRAEQRREDSMAVMIQQLVGAERNGYWYPSLSGVGQSHNFYPVMGMEAADGVAHIALGLGKTVVDGGKSLWFSPAYPKKLVQFSSVEDILANSQRQFYALSMKAEQCVHLENSNLVLRRIQDAATEYPVMTLSSTYVPDEHRIRDIAIPGVKVMTFAQFLKYSNYPLAETLQELLAIGHEGMGGDIEIEFAVGLEENLSESTFYFLQIRPMISGGEHGQVQICDDDRGESFCVSSRVLGHGVLSGMCDILYVDPKDFVAAKTADIAQEIGALARKLSASGKSFVLIGPGRWGTSDPWLGIPVQWSDISGVGAIVEVQSELIRADPSQGSHFFQNITSLGIPYFTVAEKDGGSDFVNWEWLRSNTLATRGRYVSHIHFENAFTVKCDGTRGEGVILMQKISICD